MYRKKFKGKNHEVLSREKIQSETIYDSKKNKLNINWKGMTIFSGILLIFISILFLKKELREYQEKKRKEVLAFKNESDEEEKVDNKDSAQGKREADFIVNPMTLAVMKGELFEIEVMLVKNEIGESDFLTKYLPQYLEAKYVSFWEKGLDGEEKVDKDGGRVIIRDRLLRNIDRFKLIFEAKNEGMNEIELVYKNVSKKILVNVVLAENVNAEINCESKEIGVPEIIEINKGPSLGQVEIVWEKGRENYFVQIKYGQNSGIYEFGSAFLEDDGEEIIGGLKPGEKYFFVIQKKDNCNISLPSEEKSAEAGFGGMSKMNNNMGIVLPVSEELIP